MIDESRRAAAVVAGLKSLIRDANPAIAPLDVEDAMREVTSLATAALAREHVLLETEFPTNLPRALGDRVQVQQVIVNLVRNAIDAMRTITRRRALSIGANLLGGQIVLFVADNGIGIAPPAHAEVVRRALHDQASWHRSGAGNFAQDRCCAWRSLVGRRARGRRRDVSILSPRGAGGHDGWNAKCRDEVMKVSP
ncbi:MAG: ATP-binding protein [Aliidongia sp.]